MSAPSPISYASTVNGIHPEGVQGSPAAALLDGVTAYGGQAVATAWNDVAAGVIRFQVGQAGYPALMGDDVTIQGRGGVPTGAPAVLAQPGGKFYVVWSEAGADGTLAVHQQMFALGSDGTAAAAAAATTLASGATGFAAADLAGASHAVARSGPGGIVLDILPDAGGAATSYTLTSSAGAANLSVADLGNNLVGIAYDVAGKVHLDVFDAAAGRLVATQLFDGADPAIAALGDGRVALAYESSGIRGAVLDIGPKSLTLASTFAEPAGAGTQSHAALVSLGDGGFVVGWTDGGAVVGHRYGADGTADGEAFALGAFNPAGEDHVALYSLGAGRFGSAFETNVSYADPDRGVAASAFSYPVGIRGTDAGEVIQGTDAADAIDARGGDDTVHGHGGPDVIDGGAGNDELWGSGPGEGGYDKDEIRGGAGNDVLHASDGGAVLSGDAGDDVMFGGAGQDEIHAGPGHDIVAAGGEDDIIYVELDGVADQIDGGEDGYYGDLLVLNAAKSATALNVDGSKATLTLSDGTTVTNVERLDVTGSALNDRIIGKDQADGSYSGDYIRGGLGDDYIDGRAGDDKLWGGGGNDTVLGGSGDDEISVRAGSTGIVDGGAGKDLLRIDALDDDGQTTDVAIRGDLSGVTGSLDSGLQVSNVERIEVSGSNAGDDLRTGAGDDFIRGWGGNDRFSTGAGNDWIDGGAGADTIDAGAGDDTIVITGGEGGDQIDGGSGYDKLQLDFYDSEVPLVVTVDGSTVTLGDGARAVNIESVAINASNLGDVIRTGASNDVISARGGNDLVESGAGNDLVNGGEGDDTYTLGDGDDTAVVYLDTGTKVVDGGDGTDTVEVRTLYPDAGIRMDMKAGTLGDGGTIKNVEKAIVYGWVGKVDVVTNDGDDLIYGSGSDDRIVSNGGNDVIYGGSGNDLIDAGTGRNLVSAGEGDDTIAVKGYDDVDGEAGEDLARFAGKRADYDVSVNAQGTVILTDSATGRTATVRNVEKFAFDDVTLSASEVASAPPRANPDAPAEISEDAGTLHGGSVTANDFSTSAAKASIVGPSGLVQSLDGRYGTLTISSDNTYFYVPGKGVQALGDGDHATDVFTYRITDASGRTSDSTVTISIAGSNDAPVAAAATETARGSEEAVVKGQVLAATDAEGDKLSYGIVPGSATHGSVAIDAATGAYTFTPDRDFNGVASFSYVASDGKASSTPKTVTVVIDPVNDAPVAATAAEAFRGAEDAVVRGTLLAGSDVDGDRLSFRVVEGSAQNGSVTVDAATGAFAFTPDKDYNGPATFSYVVTDGTLSSAPKAVSLTLDPVNDAPVAAAAAETFRGSEDQALRGTLLKGSDVDGDALTFRLVAGSAAHGSVTLDAATGAFTFMPDTDWNGTTGFSYVVNDGKVDSAPKAVSLTLDPVNDAPVAAAAAEAVRGSEDTAIKGQLLAATDVDGDRLSYGLVAGSATHGSVAIDAATGAYAFTPDKDFNGVASFSYVAGDGALSSAPKTVTVTVDAVNDAPVAATAAEAFRGSEDQAIKGTLLKGSDVDGDRLAFKLVAGSAAHGTVVLDEGTGAFTFTPDKNYNGPATFSYVVTDGTLSSQPKAVSLTLDPVNDAPVASAAAEAVRGSEDGAVKGQVLAATDVDGDKLGYVLAGSPVQHGSVALDPSGSFTFTPDKDWFGTTTFQYAATDGSLSSARKTVTVTVDPANDAPVAAAAAESAHGPRDAVLKGQLLAGSDVDGDKLAFKLVEGSALHGTVILDTATGAYSFTPEAGYAGPASFSYVVTDGTLSSQPKAVSLTLDAMNHAPVAASAAEAYRGAEDAVLRGQVLAGSDADGDRLGYKLVEGPAAGNLVLNADGTFAFTPAKDWNGSTTFKYAVDDGSLSSAAKTVTLTVDPVNDAPVAGAAAEAFRGKEDAPLSGRLLAGTDVDGDALGFRLVAGSAAHGSVALDAVTGAFTFTPDKDWNGTTSFSYVLTDDTLSSAPKSVSLTLDPVNDAPVVASAAEAYTLAEDAVLRGTLAGGSDVDGDALSYQLVAGSATHGTAAVDAATGAFSFTPVGDYNGAAEFRYKVFDGTALSAEKTVSLNVGAVNDGPVARDDGGFSVDAGKAIGIQGSSLLANDTDVDGDRLLITGVSNAVGGTASLDKDGNVTFTAASGFSGNGGFSYAVSDGHGGVATAKVAVAVSGAATLPTINGTDNSDVIVGTDKSEAINGKGGIDLILAGGGDDVVRGGDGSDVIYGDRGHDKLYGDRGSDALFGGDGNDLLDGGTGDDILTGGAGADTFVFRKDGGTDTVTDFQAGVNGGDILDVSALGFRNLDEVKAASHEVKLLGITLATVIDAPDGTTVNLALTKLSDLHKGDFIFA